MTRPTDDTWDVTESVGHTAVQVALGRMAETLSEDPLFIDHYAQLFVEAALESGWTPPFTEDQLTEMTAADPLAIDRLMAMRDYTAVRTRFFDDFLSDAAASGVDQAVIVAAGLDSRGWRLDLPPGFTVFEIDQPDVLDFKTRILDVHGAKPVAGYVPVAADLRGEWEPRLRSTDFDGSRPSAWVVEGLLPYISGAAQDSLFERIDGLAAPGSRIAVEAFDEGFYDVARARSGGTGLVGQGSITVEGRTARTENLFVMESHADVTEWLVARGWTASAARSVDEMARYGRAVHDDIRDKLVDSRFVSGERPAVP